MLALLALAPFVQAAPGGDLELVSSLGLGSGTLPGGSDTGAIAIVDGDTRYYGSSLQVGGVPQAHIERRDRDNQLVWSGTIERDENVLYVNGLVPSDEGGVIAVLTEAEGFTSLNTNVLAVRFDASGNVIWETVIDPQATIAIPFPTDESVRANCAAPDGAGGVWIGGLRLGSNVGLLGTLFHISEDGLQLPDVLPFGTNFADVYDIEPLPGGDLLIAAGVPAGNFAARLDAATLQPVWTLEYGAVTPDLDAGLQRFLREFVVDENGVVYGGFSNRSQGSRVARIDPADGLPVWIVDPVPPAVGGTADGLAPWPGGGVLSVGTRNTGFVTGGADTLYARSIAPDGLAVAQELDIQQSPGIGLRIQGAVFAFGSLFVHGSSRAVAFGDPVLSAESTNANLIELRPNPAIGERYCSPALANSTGQLGIIQAFGSDVAAANDVVLVARRLPAGQFGLFVSGSERGTTPLLGGSMGALCIEGNLGRFSASLGNTGFAGVLRQRIDTSAIPTAQGDIAATAGLTWHFQCWHRDLVLPSPSNTTDAVSIAFQ